jgi:hypothetical protein
MHVALLALPPDTTTASPFVIADTTECVSLSGPFRPLIDIFIKENAASGPKATGDTERAIKEEADVESAEYIRTPDGRNVVRKVIHETETAGEKS